MQINGQNYLKKRQLLNLLVKASMGKQIHFKLDIVLFEKKLEDSKNAG